MVQFSFAFIGDPKKGVRRCSVSIKCFYPCWKSHSRIMIVQMKEVLRLTVGNTRLLTVIDVSTTREGVVCRVKRIFFLLLLNCALSIERSAVEFVLSACLLLSNAQYLLRLVQLIKTSVTLTCNPQDIHGEGQKRTPLILIVHKPSR